MKTFWRILTFAIFFTNGCARTENFLAVDKLSGKSIEGVSIQVQQRGYDLLFGEKRVPDQSVWTDQRGIAVARNLRRDMEVRTFFTKAGYATNFGVYSSGGLAISHAIEPIPGAFMLKEPLIFIQPTNNFLVVPLSPIEAITTKPIPH